MAKNVRVEWRQGTDGSGSTYKFFPNPNPTRVEPSLKQAEFNIPLSDGVLIQDLGKNKRVIVLTGILVATTRVFEDLEDKRLALINGIGTGPGQLHFISLNPLVNAKHFYYIGQINTDGIGFSEQTNPMFLEYTITFVCANPASFNVNSHNITSNAKVV